MNRRDFLQQLGLGSIGVAIASAPALAYAIDKSIEEKITSPEQFLNKKITAYTYRVQKHPKISVMSINNTRTVIKGSDYVNENLYSKWYTDKLECEYMAMLDLCRVNPIYKKHTFKNLVEEFDYYENTIVVEEHEIPISVYANNMFNSGNISKKLLFKGLEIQK